MRLTNERGLVLLLFAFAVAASVGTATDPDLWWHLRTGEVIVEDGIPRTDIFSYTVAGTDWITHEWGSQVLMWLLWSAGGSSALIVVFTAVVGWSLALAFRTSRARPLVTVGMVVLAALVARIATAPRPQMFNLLFLAGLILLLERIRQDRLGPRWVWAAAPLIVVWANLHSGYLLGIVTLAVYAVGERLEARRHDGRPMPVEATRVLPAVAGASFVGAALNPSGLALWTYPLETLRSDAMREYIQEWHSPDFHSTWFWPFALMLVVSVVAVVASPRRPGATQMLLLVGTGLAGLQSMRHIPLFAIVAVPIVAEQIEVAIDAQRVRQRTSAPMRASIVAPLLAVLAMVVAVGGVAAAISSNDDAVAAEYPVAAVDAILASDLADARGYNAYGWGGYLIWRDIDVFIDGRADVYGDEFMRLHFQAEKLEADWREPLDAFDVEYVLLAPDAEFGLVLDEAVDWTEVYSDDVASVWARCTVDCPVVSGA
ncbi:MAG: hypothetical protein AAF480_04680 [Actinomycetota bacterium]